MRKLLSLCSVAATALALLSTSALAWDNCGHGFHRNYSGYCVSNYGRTSGCPWGYHMGWNVHACVPNR
jgi:hypothetical protein